MPQTILDLGRIVKQKHPEYGDLADDEVGRKVKGKFPGAYDDFMDAPALPTAPLPAGLAPRTPAMQAIHDSPVLGAPVLPAASFIPTAVGYGASKLGEMVGLPDWANTGIGIVTSLAAESPRLQGGAFGAAKGSLEAASHGLHFFNPIAWAKGAYKGAQEGMSGKLPLGPVARDVRDWMFPKVPPDISGSPSTMPPDVAQYGRGAHPVRPPVEVGGAYVPDYVPSGLSPAEAAARIQKSRYPTLDLHDPRISDVPGGSFGSGPQTGFGSVDTRPPIAVGGAHIPSLTLPEFGSDGWPLPSPAEMQQKLSALPETAGPTANSPGANARFTKGQYDAPRPTVDTSSRYRQTQPVISEPPTLTQPTAVSPEEMQQRLKDVKLPDWYGGAKKTATKKVSAPAAPPAAPVTPAALPTTSPVLPDVVTPAGAPAATNGGYAFTHPTGSMTDLRKQLFATGQEMELPGSPAKTRATQHIRDSSMELFGKSVSNLEHGELFKLNEFLAKHKRLPTRADLDLMGH